MQPKHHIKVYHEDRLVIRWTDIHTRESHSQGKRVGADCTLTREELRTYVKSGSIALVACLVKNRSISFQEAMQIMLNERGKIYHASGSR